MILTTRAHCINHPPCEWAGTTDRSAEKHTKETGHGTVSESILVRVDGGGNGTISTSEAVPALAPEPPLTPRMSGASR